MSRPRAPETPLLRWFVLLYASVLAAVAGFVNSVLLVVLIYPVSHVSGSLSHFSMDVVDGNFGDLRHLVVILLSFFAGAVAAGAILGDTTTETGRRYGAALVIESGLLCAATVLGGSGHVTAATAAAALACGLQNAMFSTYRGLVIRTTHLTGTFTDLGVLIGRSNHRDADLWKCVLLLATIVAFVVGGVLGAGASAHSGATSLAAPAVTCFALGTGYFFFHHHMRTRKPDDPSTPTDSTDEHRARELTHDTRHR
jgi:uncharacterized membrane protein YoaK (UPF0700 family)